MVAAPSFLYFHGGFAMSIFTAEERKNFPPHVQERMALADAKQQLMREEEAAKIAAMTEQEREEYRILMERAKRNMQRKMASGIVPLDQIEKWED